MKKIFLIILMIPLVSFAADKAKKIEQEKFFSSPVIIPASRFDFQSIVVSQAVQLIFSEALKTPYVLEPDVLTDTRLVSFRYESSKGEIHAFVNDFLDSIGLAITEKNGVAFVHKKPIEKEVYQKPGEPEKDVFIYRPKYRDVDFLARLLQPLFKGSFTSNRSVAAPPGAKMDKQASEGSAMALIDQSSDVLVFNAEPREIEKLKKILPDIDGRQGEVVVRAAVYEVTSTANEGSAFSLALSLLNSKLGISLGAVPSLANAIHIKSNTIDAVFAALSGDSHFNTVSTPSLRVRSGSTGRFTVGQDVPILGSVTYPGNGQAPVQSINYISSGVIFEVSPTVHESIINLVVNQELSNFVTTDTGVTGSPTKTKRNVSTGLSLLDGDVVVLGGLSETKNSEASAGLSFLPDFMQTKTGSKNKTEIILVLQVAKI